jgi:hypothetical protein
VLVGLLIGGDLCHVGLVRFLGCMRWCVGRLRGGSSERAGCGYVAVCRHCELAAPGSVGEAFCDAEQRRLKIGTYEEGHPRTREEWVREW